MLTWQQGLALTLALSVLAIACSAVSARAARGLVPFAREATIIAGLYSLWQLAGSLAARGTGGALARARWIERAERELHLPRESDLQPLLEHRLAAQAANLYYATMHFGVLFVFLIWLFVRHRDHYRAIRRVLAVTTLLCLLVQLVPVAPPRLLPGFVDVAARYHQSVYGSGVGADELSAMPSVHVAWAVLIGWSVWRIGRGRWRALGPVHAAVTVFVVVSTANHWWADGIVAVAVLGIAWLLCRGAARMLADRLPRPQRMPAPASATLPTVTTLETS
jgi:PAP2 superfamily